MTSPEITPGQAAYEAKLAAEGARHGITLTSAWDGFAGRDDWEAGAEAVAGPVRAERDEARAELAAEREQVSALRSVLAEIFASMGMNATQYPQDLQKVRLDDWRQRAGLVTP